MTNMKSLQIGSSFPDGLADYQRNLRGSRRSHDRWLLSGELSDRHTFAMRQELEDTFCIIVHESRLASMADHTILAAAPETLNLSKLTASRWPS